jgi:hypothetical protein
MSEDEMKKCGCGGDCGCESGCGCEDNSCGCGSECGDSCGSEDQMPKMMMAISNQAWAELLKDKMKKHLEAVQGKKLDAMAKVSVDACIAYWDGKMQQKDGFEDFAEKLKNAMNS